MFKKLAAFFAVCLTIYTSFWYVWVGRVEERLLRQVATLNQQTGLRLDYRSVHRSGFPGSAVVALRDPHSRYGKLDGTLAVGADLWGSQAWLLMEGELALGVPFAPEAYRVTLGGSHTLRFLDIEQGLHALQAKSLSDFIERVDGVDVRSEELSVRFEDRSLSNAFATLNLSGFRVGLQRSLLGGSDRRWDVSFAARDPDIDASFRVNPRNLAELWESTFLRTLFEQPRHPATLDAELAVELKETTQSIEWKEQSAHRGLLFQEGQVSFERSTDCVSLRVEEELELQPAVTQFVHAVCQAVIDELKQGDVKLPTAAERNFAQFLSAADEDIKGLLPQPDQWGKTRLCMDLRLGGAGKPLTAMEVRNLSVSNDLGCFSLAGNFDLLGGPPHAYVKIKDLPNLLAVAFDTHRHVVAIQNRLAGPRGSALRPPLDRDWQQRVYGKIVSVAEVDETEDIVTLELGESEHGEVLLGGCRISELLSHA